MSESRRSKRIASSLIAGEALPTKKPATTTTTTTTTPTPATPRFDDGSILIPQPLTPVVSASRTPVGPKPVERDPHIEVRMPNTLRALMRMPPQQRHGLDFLEVTAMIARRVCEIKMAYYKRMSLVAGELGSDGYDILPEFHRRLVVAEQAVAVDRFLSEYDHFFVDSVYGEGRVARFNFRPASLRDVAGAYQLSAMQRGDEDFLEFRRHVID